jgi:cold shock CspA family protein
VRSRQGALFPFHSTQIEDGTRRIAVGTAVTFDVVAGHRGQWEAAALSRC